MKFTKETVKKIAEKSENEADFVINLYMYLYGDDWYNIEKINGFPKCGKELSDCIWNHALEFVKRDNPEGLQTPMVWFNSGFSTDEKMPQWEAKKTGTETFC